MIPFSIGGPPSSLPPEHSSRARPYRCTHVGSSLAELLVVLVVMGVIMAIATRPIVAALDRAAVRASMAEMATLFGAARQQAIEDRTTVVVRIDSVAGSIRVTMGSTTVLERRLAAAYRVCLAATRDSMAYDAHGLGLGAANLSIVVRRGQVADTLYLSRLGRVRW